MSGENEPIRANRLSNREVMLSAAGLHNMPSTSGGSGNGAYYTYGNRLSSVSSSDITPDQSKSDQSPNEATTLSTSSSSVAANRVFSSTSKSNADETDTNIDDDELSLSQYELDIVNKYLNEMCESDDQAQIIVSDEEKHVDESMMITKQNDDLVIVDQCNDVESESQSQSQSQSQPASTPPSSSSSSSSSLPLLSPVQEALPTVSNANANDEMQYTQTSRQSGFDQSNATINQIMQSNNASATHSHIGTHNDVNNNISLSSTIGNNHSASEASTALIDHGQRRYPNDSHRPCNNNNNNSRRANPNSSRINSHISANLPIVVGITSCIWGLFFYAVKSFYSDLT